MVGDNSIYVPWSIRSRSKHYLWCGVWGAGGDRELGAGGGMDFSTSVALPPRLRSYLAVRFYTHASDVQRHSVTKLREQRIAEARATQHSNRFGISHA